MGKHFSAELYRQFDRQMDKGLDEAMGEDEPTLSEEERAAAWDDSYWERIDAVRRYALPVTRVQLRDEPGRAA